jgi:hypothetical protein
MSTARPPLFYDMLYLTVPEQSLRLWLAPFSTLLSCTVPYSACDFAFFFPLTPPLLHSGFQSLISTCYYSGFFGAVPSLSFHSASAAPFLQRSSLSEPKKKTWRSMWELPLRFDPQKSYKQWDLKKPQCWNDIGRSLPTDCS